MATAQKWTAKELGENRKDPTPPWKSADPHQALFLSVSSSTDTYCFSLQITFGGHLIPQLVNITSVENELFSSGPREEKKSMKWKRTTDYHSLLLSTMHCQISPKPKGIWMSQQLPFEKHLAPLNKWNLWWKWLLVVEQMKSFYNYIHLCWNSTLPGWKCEDKCRILVLRITFLQKKVLSCRMIAATVQLLCGNHLLVYSSLFTKKLFFKWHRASLVCYILINYTIVLSGHV